MTELVQEKLQLLPNSPGVYIMKDEQGRIIYVGKAVILKNRVRQYFQNSRNHSAKVKAMVAKIADFETIITGNFDYNYLHEICAFIPGILHYLL